MTNNINDQFTFKRDDYLQSLDFINWYRQYYLLREVLDRKVENVLEIGVGIGILANCLAPMVKNFTTFDINPNLNPDIVGDITIHDSALNNKFDCIIVADILEHIEFYKLENVLKNLNSYLVEGGFLLVTIPHRRSNFLFMTPTQVPHVFTVPTGFLSFGAFYRRFIKRKIAIDPNHYWEIGDGNITRSDVNCKYRNAGFDEVFFKKLVYVDYWCLKK